MAQIAEDVFEKCREISSHLNSGNESKARNLLILLLEEYAKEKTKYPELVTHLIRQVGLYPYMLNGNSIWQDKYLLELFTQEIGGEQSVILHREQARVLKGLLSGKSLAISAPTSFGKSFIIDAFIKENNPNTVVIIVPTIALMDETRRRLYKKFSKTHKIITTVDSDLEAKSILIFPQERALSYLEKLNRIDLLVVDEFYKASPDFDKERSHSLIKSILILGSKAKQRYYLAPNISSLPESPLTSGMEFDRIDFNTVVTKIVNKYTPGITDEERFEIYKAVIPSQTRKHLSMPAPIKTLE